MAFFNGGMGLALSCVLALAFISPADAETAAARDWNGCYGGFNTGVGAAQNHGEVIRDVVLAVPFNQRTGDATAYGLELGGQFGCDMQKSDWVFGARGLVDFAQLRGDHHYALGTASAKTEYRINGYGTLTARLGKLLNPNLLPYINAGAAWTQTNYVDSDPVLPLGPYVGKESTARFGALVGFGVEQRLQGNWSAFAEYDYMYFGHENVRLFYNDGAIYDYKFRQAMSNVTLGVNYRF